MLIASLRVIAVTNISMVAVGSVIGIGGLGTWFTEGYQADKSDQIVAGIIAIFVLAIVIDTLIMALGWAITPWVRATRTRGGAERRRAMNFLQQALSYIFTAANWGGPAGLPRASSSTCTYTAVAVVFSALIAIPIGMLIGHTGRGTFLVVTGVNALRALPTLGVLLLGVLLWGLGLVPPTVALMLLGIPPLLAGTYAGIANVDPDVVDAARAMGMTEIARPAAGRDAERAAVDPRRAAHRDAADRRDGDGGRLRQPRRAGPLPDRRHQGAPVLHRVGGRADGDGAGADPRRRAGVRGVGVGAGHRADAGPARRCPQPLLGDEVALDPESVRDATSGPVRRAGPIRRLR